MLRSNGKRFSFNFSSFLRQRAEHVNQRKSLSVTASSKMAASSTKDDQSENGSKSVLASTVFKLETLDPYLYRSENTWHSFGPGKRLFGGQVISQAMAAAGKTVSPELSVHSVHSYFVKGGDKTAPILFRVENQRDGHSFCTRSVEAVQNGRVILSMMASYHRPEESPYHHQYGLTMPKVPDPDAITNTDEEEINQVAMNPNFPERMRKWSQKQAREDFAFESKHVDRANFIKTMNQPVDPKLLIWMKVKGDIEEKAGENVVDLHHCCLAYISDLFLISMPYFPHRDRKPLGMVCSLDHTIWFHAPCRIDEWMLYDCECPQAGHGRGMSTGRFWRRDGVLAVSVASEILLRPKM